MGLTDMALTTKNVALEEIESLVADTGNREAMTLLRKATCRKGFQSRAMTMGIWCFATKALAEAAERVISQLFGSQARVWVEPALSMIHETNGWCLCVYISRGDL